VKLQNTAPGTHNVLKLQNSVICGLQFVLHVVVVPIYLENRHILISWHVLYPWFTPMKDLHKERKSILLYSGEVTACLKPKDSVLDVPLPFVNKYNQIKCIYPITINNHTTSKNNTMCITHQTTKRYSPVPEWYYLAHCAEKSHQNITYLHVLSKN